MKLTVVEDSKTKLVFEISEGHAFCNALKDELVSDAHVKLAAYRRDHPLINTSRFQVETDAQATPKQAVQKAITRLSTKNKSLRQHLTKTLK